MPIATIGYPEIQRGLTDFGGSLAQGIQARLQRAEAEKQEAINPYVGQLTAEDLQKAKLYNQYYGRDIESQIGLRGAQAGLAGSEAEKNRYLLAHPGLMGGEEAKTIAALQAMGILPKNLNAPTTTLAQGISNQLPMPELPTPNLTIPQRQTQDLRTSLSNALFSQQNAETPQLSQVPEMPSAPAATPQMQNVNPAQPFQTGNPLVDAILNKGFISSAYQNQMLKGYNWAHLPADAKNQLVAQGYGMGIAPLKMMNYINQGYDISQIAQAEGLDPNNLPPPMYPPTEATKTRVQLVEQVGREIDYMSSAISQKIKPYADTFLNISGDKLSDMLSNDPEAQKRYGQYVGALSLQSGLNAGRLYLEGGRPSKYAMEYIKKTALDGIDTSSSIKMTKVAYQAAQDTIDEILQKGAKIRTSTGMNPFSEIGKAHGNEIESQTKNENGTPVIKWTRDKNGKLVRSS